MIPKTIYELILVLSVSNTSTKTAWVFDLYRSRDSFKFFDKAAWIGAIELKSGMMRPTIQA